MTAWTACLDFETTGLDTETCAPVSWAVARAARGEEPCIVGSGLVNPGHPIPAGATKIHGITDADVADAKPWPDAAVDVLNAMVGASAIACHNAPYDVTILHNGLRRLGGGIPNVPIYCTLAWARAVWWGTPETGRRADRPPNMTLVKVADRLGVDLDAAHHADADALAVARILRPLFALVHERCEVGNPAAFTARVGAEQDARLAEVLAKPNERRWERLTEILSARVAA